MSNPKPRQLSELGQALERISKQTSQIGKLSHARDVAERQVQSLTRELQAARREIARLQSLAPHQQDK